MEEQDTYKGSKWDSAEPSLTEGVLPGTAGERPWTAMLVPGAMSRPSYTEGAKAKAVTRVLAPATRKGKALSPRHPRA